MKVSVELSSGLQVLGPPGAGGSCPGPSLATLGVAASSSVKGVAPARIRQLSLPHREVAPRVTQGQGMGLSVSSTSYRKKRSVALWVADKLSRLPVFQDKRG